MNDFAKRFARRRSKSAATRPSPVPPPSVRAKSQRHGKVTADHWNQ